MRLSTLLSEGQNMVSDCQVTVFQYCVGLTISLPRLSVFNCSLEYIYLYVVALSATFILLVPLAIAGVIHPSFSRLSWANNVGNVHNLREHSQE